jgi:glyoxylase-like metal-dependent hydrolase (beta-lactamase superfamily II)
VQLRPAIEPRPVAGGGPEAAEIGCLDVEASLGEEIADVLVAPAMLGEAVDDHDRREGRLHRGTPAPHGKTRPVARRHRFERSRHRRKPSPGEIGCATIRRVTDDAGRWTQIGDGVFTLRYRFFNQQIGVVLGDGEALVIDTRLTHRQGRQILDDLRRVTSDPVTIVVDSHWHHDHTFGNHVFRPATIWGHERCGPRLLELGERMRTETARAMPELVEDLDEVVLDPPDRSFSETARVEVGGRAVDLRFLGRGHTDSDIVVEVPDAGVLFAGDLLEEGATPFFLDGYPLDWPETVSRILERVRGPVVPGHGEIGDRAFVEDQLGAFLEVARLGREVHAARMSLDDAVAASPFSPETSRGPLERALAQLRGELD